VLAEAEGIASRLPYNSDPIVRGQINSGQIDYLDMHLSQVAPVTWQGFLGRSMSQWWRSPASAPTGC
jgi:succinyl-CoA:acetate CoA-transferase